MWIIVSYFTKDKIYESYAKSLILSLKCFNNIPYEIVPIKDQGSWDANTHYKPIFLKEMLKKYYPNSVVYVDVDAVFCQYPKLFDELDKTNYLPIAVHILDHSKYRKNCNRKEMLSGTIFLKNTKETQGILDEWIVECKKDPKLWDQKALEIVLKDKQYFTLPEEYCCIFDTMSSVKEPVIKQFQASREARHPRTNKVVPKIVDSKGSIRIK
jgi:hypothetical protein